MSTNPHERLAVESGEERVPLVHKVFLEFSFILQLQCVCAQQLLPRQTHTQAVLFHQQYGSRALATPATGEYMCLCYLLERLLLNVSIFLFTIADFFLREDKSWVKTSQGRSM